MTEISDSYPAGVTTSYTYNGLSQVVTTTNPPVPNPITSVTHTLVTTNSYNPNGDLNQVVQSDSTGGDTSRTTTYTYNNNDKILTTTVGYGSPQAADHHPDL